jgi:hypothetical protein
MRSRSTALLGSLGISTSFSGDLERIVASLHACLSQNSIAEPAGIFLGLAQWPD